MSEQESQPTVTPHDSTREVSLRPILTPGRWFWPTVGLLAVVVGVGIAGWITQLRDGLASAGYNDHAFWAIYIADVVTFIGVSYGGAVVSAILRLTGASWRAPLTRIAEATAVVTVLIGGAFIVPHLGRPERILELIYRPNLSSPIFWDFVAVSTYAFASIVFFFLPLVPDLAGSAERLDAAGRHRLARLYRVASLRWRSTPAQRRVLAGSIGLVAIMIIPLAVSVHSVLSWAFALMSRPWWHETIWAPYFVVAALYSGIALVILVVALFRRLYHLEGYITERHFVRLGFILVPFGAAYLYLTFADFLPDAYTGEPGVASVFTQVLIGRYAVWFWLFVVAGCVAPLLVMALPWTRRTGFIVAAAGLVDGSLWLKRMIMVVAPANYGRISGLFGSYSFTWVSVSVTLAGVAAIPLLLLLVFRLVPIVSVDEIEELAERDRMAIDRVHGHVLDVSADGEREPYRVVVHVAADTPRAALAPDDPPEARPEARPRGNRARPRWRRGFAHGALLIVTTVAVAATGIAIWHNGTARADAPGPQAPGPQAPGPRAPGSATADPPATPSGAPALALSVSPVAGSRCNLQLAASLTGGPPGAAADTVRFFVTSTEFGSPRLVPLGNASLTGGAASTTYCPTWAGPQKFTAQLVAPGGSGATTTVASASTTYAVTVAESPTTPGMQNAPKPLAGFGKGVVGMLLFILFLVWGALIVTIGRTAVLLRRRA